jgi:hypothetical protein
VRLLAAIGVSSQEQAGEVPLRVVSARKLKTEKMILVQADLKDHFQLQHQVDNRGNSNTQCKGSSTMRCM